MKNKTVWQLKQAHCAFLCKITLIMAAACCLQINWFLFTLTFCFWHFVHSDVNHTNYFFVVIDYLNQSFQKQTAYSLLQLCNHITVFNTKTKRHTKSKQQKMFFKKIHRWWCCCCFCCSGSSSSDCGPFVT